MPSPTVSLPGLQLQHLCMFLYKERSWKQNLHDEVRKLADVRKLFRITEWELPVNNCRRTL